MRIAYKLAAGRPPEASRNAQGQAELSAAWHAAASVPRMAPASDLLPTMPAACFVLHSPYLPTADAQFSLPTWDACAPPPFLFVCRSSAACSTPRQTSRCWTWAAACAVRSACFCLKLPPCLASIPFHFFHTAVCIVRFCAARIDSCRCRRLPLLCSYCAVSGCTGGAHCMARSYGGYASCLTVFCPTHLRTPFPPTSRRRRPLGLGCCHRAVIDRTRLSLPTNCRRRTLHGAHLRLLCLLPHCLLPHPPAHAFSTHQLQAARTTWPAPTAAMFMAST